MASLAEAAFDLGCQEPRDSERRHVHLLVELDRGAGSSTATVQNVSATGLLVRSSDRLAIGQTVRVDLPLGGMTEATVRWSDGHLHGCEFEKPVTPAAMSAALLKSVPMTPEAQGAMQSGVVHARQASDELGPRTKLLIIVGAAALSWVPVFGLVYFLG